LLVRDNGAQFTEPTVGQLASQLGEFSGRILVAFTVNPVAQSLQPLLSRAVWRGETNPAFSTIPSIMRDHFSNDGRQVAPSRLPFISQSLTMAQKLSEVSPDLADTGTQGKMDATVKNSKMARRYGEEFKRQAVELMIHGGKMERQVARELDVSEYSLNLWKKAYSG
jgi:hypothetical protein